MEWDFSAEQVAKGEIEYTLENFRDDFRNEVRANFPDYDQKDLEVMFHLAYDVCYCAALRQDFKELLSHCRDKGVNVDMKYLELIKKSNSENIEMLKAVFAIRVSEFMDEGLNNRDALKKLEEYHRKTLEMKHE